MRGKDSARRAAVSCSPSSADLVHPMMRTPSVVPAAVTFLLAACAVPALAQAPRWPAATWPTATPESQGLDPSPLAALRRAIDSGTYGSIDRLVVVRDGYLVVDHAWNRDYRALSRGRRGLLGCGQDACDGWNGHPEFNYFDPGTHPWYKGRRVHSLQSVTKSVTSALIGVAIGRGEIRGTDVPLLSFLDGYDLTRVDPRLRRATLDDLLTMRTGIEWHEQDRPLDSTNTTWQLEVSRDWVQFTLDQPMDADPGTKWVYNSGGSQLMSAVLRKATGQTADKYAEAHLFGPLGIRDYHWKLTPTGLPDTEGGLFLEALDLARIGWLYLNDGVWNGTRILAPGYAAASVARRADRINSAGWGYGYQWWRVDRNGEEVWAGLGFGGQFLLVLPRYRMVGVINSWTLHDTAPRGVLMPFIDALISAARPGGR